MMMTKPPDEVAAKMATYPPQIRARVASLRQFVLTVADGIAAVGPIDEALKWGEPAFLTTQSGSGSTFRIAWHRRHPTQYAMYFNCQTTLVDSFKTMFPDTFRFEGNRAIVFETDETIEYAALAACVAMALTYQLNKRLNTRPNKRAKPL